MIATKVLSAALLAACLSGCTAGLSGAVTGGSSVVSGLQSTVEQTKASLIAQELAYAHNLLFMAGQIVGAQGMVMMVPVATPVGPPTVPSPPLPTGGSTPAGTFPTSPIVTPPAS